MSLRRSLFAATLACLALASPAARADLPCGAVELDFEPGAGNLQIVVWIEDAAGKVVATPYITRLTGTFGLANRPGSALLKSDFRWPYGRREMVFPVWAHRRNKHYPRVVMGGACGNSPDSQCPGGGLCGGDCEDSTIAYHPRVSSYEPFYCSPSGASTIDALSCASKGTFSKGAYADAPAFSLYPPRADLQDFNPTVDSPDIQDYPKENDLVAVSQATPPAGALLSPPLVWFPDQLPVGQYTAWIELSAEGDVNNFDNPTTEPCQADSVPAWDFEGKCWTGQPSIVYEVPFTYDGSAYTNLTDSYAGYGSWDGSDGNLRPPDGTISDVPGSGAGRLLEVDDGSDRYRLKVSVGACQLPDMAGMPADAGVVITPPCDPPDPVGNLTLTPSATSVDVAFTPAATGYPATRYAVRYQERDTPIGDDEFDQMLAGPSLAAGTPGETLSTTLNGMQPDTTYAVAVRAVSRCNKPSPVVSQVVKTPAQKFATLSGCFVATAAFGSPMEAQVETLRAFRDHRLLTNPAGRLFTALYYTFGPEVAGAIRRAPALRALTREALRPLVDLATELERRGARPTKR